MRMCKQMWVQYMYQKLSPSRYQSKSEDALMRMRKQMQVKFILQMLKAITVSEQREKDFMGKKHHAHAGTNAGPIPVAPALAHHGI